MYLTFWALQIIPLWQSMCFVQNVFHSMLVQLILLQTFRNPSKISHNLIFRIPWKAVTSEGIIIPVKALYISVLGFMFLHPKQSLTETWLKSFHMLGIPNNISQAHVIPQMPLYYIFVDPLMIAWKMSEFDVICMECMEVHARLAISLQSLQTPGEVEVLWPLIRIFVVWTQVSPGNTVCRELNWIIELSPWWYSTLRFTCEYAAFV